jgi:hypothetical protein
MVRRRNPVLSYYCEAAWIGLIRSGTILEGDLA